MFRRVPTGTYHAVAVACLLLLVPLTGCLAPSPTDGTLEDEPGSRGSPTSTPTVWNATGCTGASLVWTPSLEALEPVVAPWTPVEGPVPGRGIFVLFTFECPDSRIAGTGFDNASIPASGGAALVPIEEPGQAYGVEAEGWLAAPEAVGDPAVSRLFTEHGFAAVKGNTSLTVERAPAGWEAGMTYTTANGSVTATGTVGGAPEERAFTTAVVAPHAEPFSVFHGPESYERRTGQAVVEASGDTWLNRLDLDPVPFSFAVDTGFDWGFAFERDAR